jgi:hypothetical protein
MALLKHNNNSISNVTSFPLVPFGSPVLLATATASASASLSFNSTYINGDYQVYKFEFINIHPSVDGADFTFNGSTDGGSTYAVTKTTTAFQAYNNESTPVYGLSYETAWDLAQSTGFQLIMRDVGTDADQNGSGTLQLFNPSSTTYVKHFISRSAKTHYQDYAGDDNIAGYMNTTSAVDAIQFKFDTGNIDSGKIKLYGLGAN